MSKTIVFCDDQDHAERMRQELVKIIPAAANNRRYVMRITGDDNEGKAQLSYFIDNDEPFPVIATTSKLLNTGVDAKTCKLIVLDQTINNISMFKQIIGRGTRIREDYQKLYFTIMDFKGATRLFADPGFDGEPVVIYEPTPDEPVVPPDDGPEQPGIINDPNLPYTPELPGGGDSDSGGRSKYFVDDVDVRLAVERSLFLDADGNLITEDYRVFLKGEIKKTLQAQFGSLRDFLRRWSEAERKQAVIDELKELGIPLKALQDAVPNSEDLDVFDLIAHVAFDQKPLTRQERANNVKKRNYFSKYSGAARQVLEALLDKYADTGIEHIEDIKILQLDPFSRIGAPIELVKAFGGKAGYTKAVQELENQLYTG